MNGILQEFVIAVGLDTKKLDSGVKGTENRLKSLGKVASSVIASFLSYKAIQSAIFGFTELADKIGHTSTMMGYSLENTHALGNALKRFGGNTDSAISSLNSLSNAIQEAKFGGGALIDVARKYGISFLNANGSLMDAESLLKSLGSQMKGFDKLTQMEIGKKLGLDDSLILALQDGGEALDYLIQRQKQLGVVTKKDYDLAQAFGNSWEELKESFKSISLMIGRVLLPPLKKLIDGFVFFIDFLRDHKALVIAFFSGLLIAMTPILVSFTQIAIASAAAFAPIYAVVGTITAIALAVEDIWVYFKGGDSVVGDLAKKFPIIKSTLEAIRPIIMGIANVFSEIMDFLNDPSWENLTNIFRAWGEAIYSFIQKPLEYVKSLISGIGDSIKGLFNASWIGGIFGMNGQPAIGTHQTHTSTSNTYNVNANINQSITSPTPQSLANQTSSAIIDSINAQRSMIGRN